jgi:Leucine-rich repeat (LRR) protein
MALTKAFQNTTNDTYNTGQYIMSAPSMVIRGKHQEYVFKGSVDMMNILSIPDDQVKEMICDCINLINIELCLIMTYFTMTFRQLTKINVSHVHIGRTFIDAINNMSNLNYLSVTDSDMHDGLLDLLHNKNIRRLTLTGNRVVVGKEELNISRLNFVRSLPNLQFLDVSDSQVSDSAMRYLHPLTNLTGLILNETYVGDECVTTLVQLTSLVELDIFDTLISEESYNYIRDNCNIKRLYHHCDSSEDSSD